MFFKGKMEKLLEKAGVDYIELGFLKEKVFNEDKTFFSSINDLKDLDFENQKYTLMINFGEYNIANFSECRNKNIKIRGEKCLMVFIQDMI